MTNHDRMHRRLSALRRSLFGALTSGVLSGCVLASDEPSWVDEAKQALIDQPDAAATDYNHSQALAYFYTGTGADALEFGRPHPTGNGRSCATCHRPEDNFALTPKTVEARWQLLQARRREDPTADDPLFRAIDADDFADDFTTLRTRALVRVTLQLPANVKLADDAEATTVSVFRAVPSVMNTAFTAPFQNDGRHATLEEQARHAMLSHSEVRSEPASRTLSQLASFQRHLFSAKPLRTLTSQEQQGRQTFERFCATCHGGPTLTVNADARFLPVPGRGPLADGPQAFVNIFVQTPRPPPPFAPAPAPATPQFFEGLPTADLPIMAYTVTLPDSSRANVSSSDPGRMLISGDLRENGRFDIPTLYGVARTAPYFHDNSAATLEAVIDHYQALFKFMAFVDVEGGLFAPLSHGQGCERGTCDFEPIPQTEIPGLLAFLHEL